MYENLKDTSRRLVGARQVMRAIRSEHLEEAYIARDADPLITRPVMVACENAKVRFTEVESMRMLGEACGIDVKAAVAGIVK